MKYTINNKPAVTLDQAKRILVHLGGTVLNGACFEDDEQVYASSVETCGPSTYNHPQYEVVFLKNSGWLRDNNGNPVNLWEGKTEMTNEFTEEWTDKDLAKLNRGIV